MRAGTVHTLADVVVFEVQENSDVTFRLYDWDHVDAKTGKPRPLQVDEAVACVDFSQVAIGPVPPTTETTSPVLRNALLECPHFKVWRLHGESPFTVGAVNTPRVLVAIAGNGELEHNGKRFTYGRGDVVLLPAELNVCTCLPGSEPACLLEVALPD